MSRTISAYGEPALRYRFHSAVAAGVLLVSNTWFLAFSFGTPINSQIPGPVSAGFYVEPHGLQQSISCWSRSRPASALTVWWWVSEPLTRKGVKQRIMPPDMQAQV
jgi:hypothetical protein